jgi:hypothetical protein
MPESAKKVALPDVAVLSRYSPTETAKSHPKWLKDRFPKYIAPHAGHEASSVREFTHAGHVVRIVTTYRVEVDGRPVRPHLSVDEDGRVYTHVTPFVAYGSAIELMKAVIDSDPKAFAPAEDTDHHDHHHGHGGTHG